MLKSLPILFSFLLVVSSLSAQDFNFDNDDAFAQFSPNAWGSIESDVYENFYLFNPQRSSVRAVLDTFKRFAPSSGIYRQTLETHYGYDANYNLNFRRNLSFVSDAGTILPNSEIFGVYNEDNQLLSDTTYVYNLNTGERILDIKRQLLYDGDGYWIGTITEKWDNNEQKWLPNVMIDRVLENGLLITQTRQTWNAGTMAFVIDRVENYEYDGSGNNVLYKLETLAMGMLRLTQEITREFNSSGQMTFFSSFIASAPDFDLRPFQQVQIEYDINGSRVQEILSLPATDGMNIWRNATRTSYTYSETLIIESILRETWSLASQAWNVTTKTDYEYDSFGNLLTTSEYTPLSVPDSWLISRMTDFTYDLDFEPGSFINPNIDFNPNYYMQTAVQINQINPAPAINSRQEYIFKLVEPNSTIELVSEIFKIFPNPFSEYIQVDFEDLNATFLRAQIFNNSGILCLNQQVHLNTPVNVAHLIPGPYILLIKSADGQVLSSRKLIKK